MRLAWRVATLAAFLALAGCSSSDSGPATVDGPGLSTSLSGPNATLPAGDLPLPPIDFDPPIDIPFGGERCHGGHVWFSVDRNVADNEVPEAYQAGNAEAIVGPVLGSGRTVVAINAFNCAVASLDPNGLTFATLAIQVEPPMVGLDLPEVDVEWYLLEFYTGHEALLQQLLPLNYTALAATVTHEVLSIPAGPATGDGAVEDEKGVVFEFKVVAALAERQIPFTTRYWQESERGVTFLEFGGATDFVQGTATCNLRETSTANDVTQSTTCNGSNTFFGWVWNDAEWDGAFHYRPAVHASVA